MPTKSAAQLDREIAEALASKPACPAGTDTDSLLSTPLLEAKHRAAMEAERCYLTSVMAKVGGSVSAGSRMTGIDRTNFRRLLQRYGIR